MKTNATNARTGSKLPAAQDCAVHRQAGFTLMELLVVMVILVLIVGVVAPKVIGYVGSSRTKAATVQIKSFATSLELFRLDAGRYPTASEGLDALVLKPATLSVWNGPYLNSSKIPKDPWGKAYHYKIPGNGRPYEIFSLGADNQVGGEGEKQDVTN